TDELESCVAGGLSDALERGTLGQDVGEAGRALRQHGAVQRPAPHVAVDEQGALTGPGIREREVRRHEGIAIADPGARHGDQHRTTATMSLGQTKTDAAHGLDHLRDVLVLRPAPPTLTCRTNPKMGNPKFFRDFSVQPTPWSPPFTRHNPP